MEICNKARLLQKIAQFRSSTFERIAIPDIVKELSQFYSFFNLYVVNIGNVPVFRVRKIVDGEKHLYRNGLWSPPSDKVISIGRANDVGESIFYGAFDPLTAIQEGRINVGEMFSLAIYHLEPKEDFDMSSIVISNPGKATSQSIEINECSEILCKFMIEEFTKTVNIGNEREYKVCCALSKLLLSMSYKDSIVYPSIQNQENTNIVMKVDAALKRLKLIGVTKGTLVHIKDNNTVEIIFSEMVNISGVEEDDLLNYQLINEEKIPTLITSDSLVKSKVKFNSIFTPENIPSFEEQYSKFFGKSVR